jgi:hypothetical protein
MNALLVAKWWLNAKANGSFMPILKLTKRNIDAFKPEARPKYYFDCDIPGFFIRVMPSGLKSWGLEYRAGMGSV